MGLRGVLLKFGEYKYMIDLLVNGNVYCNTLHYFVNCDNDEQRDSYEIATDIYNLSEAVMEMKFPDEPDSKYKSLNVNDLRMVGSYDSTMPCGNIYCLHYSEALENDSSVHKRFNTSKLEIGDYCVVITNPSEFLKRLKNAISEKKYNCQSGLVKYSDFGKLNGGRTPFMKHLDFQHQNEFRIFIDAHSLKPISFNIGNIEDIAFIVRGNDALNLCYKTIE